VVEINTAQLPVLVVLAEVVLALLVVIHMLMAE
jgi:hypothetical protein